VVARRAETCRPGWLPSCEWNNELYVRRNGGAPRRLTFDKPSESQPVWSPHGTWIAFLRGRPEGYDGTLMAMRPNGSGLHKVLG
jgi:Tol biopolymer transport system component